MMVLWLVLSYDNILNSVVKVHFQVAVNDYG